MAQPVRRRGHRPARPAARRPRPEAPGRLIERFELDPTKKARTYSKGNRQKVALVAALASDVELLILDEPTSGLDPLMEAVFKDCIDEVKDEGRTVLLSSHILAEVEALCDRVSIIRAGRTVETGTLAELRHLTRTSISAEIAEPPSGLDAWPACTTSWSRAAGDVRGRHRRARRRAQALGRFGIRTLTSQPPTLEELFLRHYGDESQHDARSERMTSVTAFTGTLTVLRFHLRRDRMMLFWWIAGIVLLTTAGRQHRRALSDPGRSRQSRGRHGGQRGVHRDGRSRRGLNTLGGQVAWQAAAFGRSSRR